MLKVETRSHIKTTKVYLKLYLIIQQYNILHVKTIPHNATVYLMLKLYLIITNIYLTLQKYCMLKVYLRIYTS